MLLAIGAIGVALSGCAMSSATRAATGAQLSEDEATARAVALLRGTDYGDSYPGIINRIKEKRLLVTGSNDCGPITRPVWAFRFQSPHEGWLYVDASTGEKACSSLPFAR